MKKFLPLTMLFFAFLLAYSCTQALESDEFPDSQCVLSQDDSSGQFLTVTANLEGFSPETKTELAADGSFRWSPGDTISLIFGSGSGDPFISTNTEPAATTQFDGYLHAVTGFDENAPDLKFWGIYPYRADDEVVIENGAAYAYLQFPSSQRTGENTWGQGQVVYMGQSSGLAIGFRNLGGGYKFYLCNDDIKEIHFRGNSNEVIAGLAQVGMTNGIPSIIGFDADDSSTEIVLYPPQDAATGVATFKKSVGNTKYWYYISVPEKVFENGCTFTMYTTDDRCSTRVLSGRRTTTRNSFNTWSNIPLDDPRYASAFDDIPAAANEIIYFASAKIENTFTQQQGVSNTFSGGRGVLSFPSAVTEIPANAFKSQSGLTAIFLPEGVQSIGDNAFQFCTSLATVRVGEEYNLGSTITTIGNYAFYHCTSLQQIALPTSLTSLGGFAFAETGLTRIDIPQSLTSLNYIMGNPFSQCMDLAEFTGKFATSDGLFLVDPYNYAVVSVALGSTALAAGTTCVLPSGINKIGSWAMAGLKSSSLDFSNVTLTKIGFSAFYGAGLSGGLTIPESVTEIEGYAFLGCTGLSSMTFQSDNLPKIGSGALGSGTDNTQFTIMIPGYSIYTSGGADKLGGDNWSAYKRTGLDRIVVYQKDDELWYHGGSPNLSVITDANGNVSTGSVILNTLNYRIASSAGMSDTFWNLVMSTQNNVEVTIKKFGAIVRTVGEAAFRAHGDFDFVSLPNGVTSIGKNAFTGCIYLEAFPSSSNSLKQIGESAFWGCTGIPSVRLGSAMRVIYASAFGGCTSLSSVTISEGLQYICSDAFTGCTSLTSITLPSSLLGIGVYVSNGVVTGRGYNPFRGCTSLETFYGGTSTGYSITSDHKFLLTADGKLLISGAIGGFVDQTCTIPSSVEETGPMSMSGGRAAVLVLASASNLRQIGGFTFENFSSGSTSIFVPASVENIVAGAFKDFTFTSPSSALIFPHDVLPSVYTDSLGDSDDTFFISIPGYATIASNSMFNDAANKWYDYRLSGRIHVYQDEDEIWYKISTELSTIPIDNQLNFGTESLPVHAVGSGCLLISDPFTLEPLSGSESFSAPTGTSLGMQKFDGVVTSVPDNAFSGESISSVLQEVWLPYAVSKIGNNAFKNCSLLEHFPKHKGLEALLTSIGSSAFNGCSSMTSDLINASNVTSLGAYAFYLCSGIENIRLGGCPIPNYAFTRCTSLQSVTFQNISQVTSVGGMAFAGCTNLKKVARSTYTAERIFLQYATTVAFAAFQGCTSLTYINLPVATFLGNNAFENCTSLTDANLPLVETIESECFKGQHKLTSLALPKVQTIGTNALGNGTRLSTVAIGQDITSLENSLFSPYSGSQTKPTSFQLQMAKATPPAISSSTFTNLSLQASSSDVPFTIKLPTQAIRNAYYDSWRTVEPFSSFPVNTLRQIFIY